MKQVTVRRVILDANYIRMINSLELEALRAQGLRLSISAFAFSEVWVSAVERGRHGLLFGSMKRIAPHLDSVYPVALGSQDLKRAVDATSMRQQRIEREKERAAGRWVLSVALDAKPMHPVLVERLGHFFDDTKQRHLGEWSRMLEEAKMWLEAESESPNAEKLAAWLARTAGASLAKRLDAFYRVTAMYCVRALQTDWIVKDNHTDDMTLLQFAGIPALVATFDLNLIEAVDASGSYQAPWVRTLGELLTDPLPKGDPWGDTAKRQAARFRRRTRDELVALEKDVRERLKKVSIST